MLTGLPDDLRFVLGLHEGSVVGMATGWAIGREAPALAILHRPAPRAFKPGETLQPQARALLQKLEMLDDFQRIPHIEAYGVCSAWGSDKPRSVLRSR